MNFIIVLMILARILTLIFLFQCFLRFKFIRSYKMFVEFGFN